MIRDSKKPRTEKDDEVCDNDMEDDEDNQHDSNKLTDSGRTVCDESI